MAALAMAVVAAAVGPQQNDSCSSTAGAGRHTHNWKMKAEQDKKVESTRTAEKLRSQLANIEKGKSGHLYKRKGSIRAECSILEELEHSMTVSREAEKVKILQQLSKIRNNVKKLQQQLQDVTPTAEVVDNLKEMMEEVENAINAFKEEHRQIYEQLLKEEKSTINELSVFERKMELWALGNSRTEKVLKLPSARVSVDKTQEDHLLEEVVEFGRFLQRTGGQQGGWDDYDHHIFLKVWRKHKGKLSYMGEALEYLCGKTKEEIEQHDKWYQEFLTLHKRKKESIRKWREKQQQGKDGNFREKEKSEKMFKELWLQHKDTKKQKEEERKRQTAVTEALNKKKAIAFAMEQESQLKLEEEKERNQQKEHQRHMKLLLERYTLQKKEKEKLEKLEKEKGEDEKEKMKRTDTEKITKFQERDLHKLELRILQKQAKELQKLEKEKRLAKLREKDEIQVSRDPSRLYKRTKGWEECMKERAPTASEWLLRIPHRAVPGL